ncbi:hypothetical protein P3X46_007190 [Hevea brasiliensis]|uniref:Aspartic peptidase DDI1-type domain-containing protein n=1 Tax=Hevea brasiliensis TaxID=3981 RepID=A0ABQ9MSP8_HEVBR|nr:hypothetical protein P3X46_007190 [Hevea brasiliensis]
MKKKSKEQKSLKFLKLRLAKNKKEEQGKEILETFRKVEVNIPLLDAIKQVPKYAKFLKELCTTKRKLRNNEKISDSKFECAMADLGASINVMSNSVFQILNLGPLKETSVIIQLADRSNAYPLGVVEDVLVQYPTDDHSIFSIDIVDTIVQDVFELSMEDELEMVIS